MLNKRRQSEAVLNNTTQKTFSYTPSEGEVYFKRKR